MNNNINYDKNNTEIRKTVQVQYDDSPMEFKNSTRKTERIHGRARFSRFYFYYAYVLYYIIIIFVLFFNLRHFYCVVNV